MVLKEFFTGGNELKEARENKARLKKKFEFKENSGRRDKISYDKSVSIIRKHRAKIATICGGTLLSGIAMGYYLFGNDKNDFTHGSNLIQKMNTLKAPDQHNTNEMERRTDIIIEKIQKGLKSLEDSISSLIDAHADPQLGKYLKLPFDLVRYNRKINLFNQNYFTFQKELKKQNAVNFKASSAFFTFMIKGREDFNINRDISTAVTTGGFHNLSRTIKVMDTFNENNLLDMINLYHELVHAVEDDFLRRSVSPDQKLRYLNFFSEPSPGKNPKSVLLSEAFAHGMEIELVNLLLDNLLKNSAKENFSEKDIQNILTKLGLTNNSVNKDIIITMIWLASSLYPRGLVPGELFNEKFLNRVKYLITAGHKIDLYYFYPFMNQSDAANHYWSKFYYDSSLF